MQVKKLKKTMILGKLSSTERKKGFSNIYSTVVFYKTLIKKYFCLVQQSPKFAWINKQLNQLIIWPWFLLCVTELDKTVCQPYQKMPMIYLSIKQIL